MTQKAEKSRSGLFHSRSSGNYVLLWRGQEVCRYESVEAFIEAHYAGLRALDDSQAELLEKYYQSIGVATGENPPR